MNAPENPWKAVAEQRRVALVEVCRLLEERDDYTPDCECPNCKETTAALKAAQAACERGGD